MITYSQNIVIYNLLCGLVTYQHSLLKQFCPELVLVSCGFDAARGDPLVIYTTFFRQCKLINNYLLCTMHFFVMLNMN